MAGAYDDGVRMLARRPLTRKEVTGRLAARGHAHEEIESAVLRLTVLGAIDDAALARAWIGATAASRGRGRERAIAELVARGVEEDVASGAWAEATEDGVVAEDALLSRALRRRLGAPGAPVSKARLVRVYNALVFEGFGAQQVEAALVPYGLERNDR